MNSKELIGDCRKRFNELQAGSSNFELEIKKLVLECTIKSYKIDDNKKFFSEIDGQIEYLLQTTRSLHWKSFYNGWLEGRVDLTKDNNLSKNET